MAIDLTSGGLLDSSPAAAWDMTGNTGTMTVMMRFYPDAFAAGTWMFGLVTQTSSDGVEIAINNTPNMIVYLFGADTGTFTHNINMNAWNTLIYTWDQSTNLLEVYINNSLKKSASYTNNSTVTGGALSLGQSRAGGGAYNGKLANFVGLNTIATASQRAAYEADVSPLLFAPLSTIRDCYEFLGGNIISTTGASALGSSGPTAAFDHPPVYMPANDDIFVPAPAAGGFIPAWARQQSRMIGAR